MTVSHNTSLGIPIYHYSIKAIRENKAEYIKGNQKLSRNQRRKLERKLNKLILKNAKKD